MSQPLGRRIFVSGFPLLATIIIHDISFIINCNHARIVAHIFVYFIHLFSLIFCTILFQKVVDNVPMKYKIDVLSALKKHGFTTYKIRKEKLLSESTVQKLRAGIGVSWENVETICRLLRCQPGDIIEYVEDGPDGD